MKSGYLKDISMADGVEKESVSCLNCNEGCLFGKHIYCNINGQLHLQENITICKNFVHKKWDECFNVKIDSLHSIVPHVNATQ